MSIAVNLFKLGAIGCNVGLLGDPNKLIHRLARVIELMKKTTLNGVRIIEIPEYRDRLLRIQGEVLASKFHGLRLLTEQAKGEESGVSRLIVKLNGTMIAQGAIPK